MKIIMSGKSSARGRNGYYKLEAAEVSVLSLLSKRPVHIDFYSSKTLLTGIGAARVALTIPDAIALYDELGARLKGFLEVP